MFERFQGVKNFSGDKTFWVSEESFLKKYKKRYHLTKKENYEKFKD
jgi:hypothetical protein